MVNAFPPGANFQRSTGDRQARFQYIDIDLSVARDNYKLPVFGADFVYGDLTAWDSENVPSATLQVGICVLRFGRKNNAPLAMRGGMRYGLGEFDAADEIFLTNSPQSGKMIRIYTSTGPVVEATSSDTQISGTVKVDPIVPDSESSNGNVFIGSASTASAANAAVQLLNPTGSGVTAYLMSLQVASTQGRSLHLFRHDTALADLGAGGPKTLGGTSAQCQVRSTTGLAVPSGFMVQRNANINQTGNVYYDIFSPLRHNQRPYILPPGTGLVVHSPPANGMHGIFEWVEK